MFKSQETNRVSKGGTKQVPVRAFSYRICFCKIHIFGSFSGLSVIRENKLNFVKYCSSNKKIRVLTEAIPRPLYNYAIALASLLTKLEVICTIP